MRLQHLLAAVAVAVEALQQVLQLLCLSGDREAPCHPQSLRHQDIAFTEEAQAVWAGLLLMQVATVVGQLLFSVFIRRQSDGL